MMTKENHLSNIVQKAQTHAISEVKKFETNLLTNVSLNKKIVPSFLFSNLVNPISDFHFAENGDSLCLSIKDKVLLWDLQTEKIVHAITLPHNVTNFAITKNGKKFITHNIDNLFVWDIQTGKTIQKIKTNFEHNNLSKRVIMSPDGQCALITGDDTHLFNLQTGQQTQVFPTRSQSICISEDSKFLASTALDHIKLFDFHTGQMINRYPKPDPNHRKHHVMRILFDSSSSSLIAYCYETNYLSFIDIRTGYIWQTIHFSQGGTFASSQVYFMVDQNNKNIYILTQDSIQVYDIESDRLLSEIPGKFYSLRNNFRHNIFAALDGDIHKTGNRITLWQMDDFSKKSEISNSIVNETFVTQSEDSKSFIFFNSDAVTKWQLETNQNTTLVQAKSKIREVVTHQKSGRLLVAQANYENHEDTLVYCENSIKESEKYIIQTNFPTPMAFSSDAKDFSYYYVSKTKRGGWISIRSAENGNEIQDINIKFVPKLMCFSPDNTKYYTVVDHDFTVWDTRSGQILDQFRLEPSSSYGSNIEKIHINQAGNIIIYCFYHINLYIVFDLLTKKSLYKFQGSNFHFLPPDEKSYLSFHQGMITFRELATGKVIKEYPQQNGYDFLSPTGKQAFSWTDDQKINIYNPQNGELLGSTYHLKDGYLWTTPPDQYNNQGWLYTNRFDLVSFAAINFENPTDQEYLTENDERIKEYLAVNNAKEMVMSRIFDPEQYKKLGQQRKNGEMVITKSLMDQRNQAMVRLLPDQTMNNNPQYQDNQRE